MKATHTCVCAVCGARFRTARHNQKYCSDLCKEEANFIKKQSEKPLNAKPIPADLRYFYELKKSRRPQKQYIDIKRENRHRVVNSGWRGQAVSGPVPAQGCLLRVVV